MRQKTPFQAHLVVNEQALTQGSEWKVQSTCWTLLRVSSGAAYWLHPRANYDLVSGSVLVLSAQAEGVIRASQLGTTVVHYFRLQPERLTGLVTLGEQQLLRDFAAQSRVAVRLYGPATTISQKFNAICQKDGSNSALSARLELLMVFSQAIEDELARHTPGTEQTSDAKMRLVQLLNQTTASELLDLSFADLVEQTRCTPRHLSRIFHQVVGMSFREKQAHVRLARAQELLATSESKVVEVALESGYQSLSLFNLMFKRRFGTTPARWREQSKSYRPAKRLANGVAILRA